MCSCCGGRPGSPGREVFEFESVSPSFPSIGRDGTGRDRVQGSSHAAGLLGPITVRWERPGKAQNDVAGVWDCGAEGERGFVYFSLAGRRGEGAGLSGRLPERAFFFLRPFCNTAF